MSTPPMEQSPNQTHNAPSGPHEGVRVVSAVLAGAIFGGLGYWIGKQGDNQYRTMAHRVLALLGAVFGASASWYATRPGHLNNGQAARTHAMPAEAASEAMAAAPQSSVEQVAHQGELAETPARELNR